MNLEPGNEMENNFILVTQKGSEMTAHWLDTSGLSIRQEEIKFAQSLSNQVCSHSLQPRKEI